MRRLLPIAMVLAAAAAEGAGAHAIAVYLLLAAVPIGAGAPALFGQLLDARAGGDTEPAAFLEPFLAGLALIVLVAGTAAGSVPAAVSGCLGIYAVQALLGLAAELRSPLLER